MPQCARRGLAGDILRLPQWGDVIVATWGDVIVAQQPAVGHVSRLTLCASDALVVMPQSRTVVHSVVGALRCVGHDNQLLQP